jgi:hypothetical protein
MRSIHSVQALNLAHKVPATPKNHFLCLGQRNILIKPDPLYEHLSGPKLYDKFRHQTLIHSHLSKSPEIVLTPVKAPVSFYRSLLWAGKTGCH